jgi:molecular chaperone GrpE
MVKEQQQQEEPEERLESVSDEPREAPTGETLQAELDEAVRERGQFKALAQRAQADLENLRKRMDEERAEVHRAASAHIITKLLPVLDDLQRALGQATEDATAASWAEGIGLIERNLLTLLESSGVTLIEADSKLFDPMEHEALYSVEDPDKEPGIVASVIRSGYRFHGRVLRAAQVSVAQGSEPEEAEHSGSDDT